MKFKLKKSLVFKFDNYRKLLRNIKFIDFYKKKISLICYLIYFNGFSLKIFSFILTISMIFTYFYIK